MYVCMYVCICVYVHVQIWTITNNAYSNMYDEAWAMMTRVGLASTYFVVCLDKEVSIHCHP